MPDTFDNVSILQNLRYHKSDVTACDFGSDLCLVTGSSDKSIVVWEWRKEVGFAETSFSPLLGHKYTITAIRFSPHSTILATASIDGTTILWNPKSGECMHTLVQDGGVGVRDIAFSHDSTVLATAGEDGSASLWDIQHGTLIRSHVCHEECVQAIVFSPDAWLLATGDAEGTCKLWLVSTLLEQTSADHSVLALATLNGAHDLGITALAFSPSHSDNNNNGRRMSCYTLASCGNDHCVRLWKVIGSGRGDRAKGCEEGAPTSPDRGDWTKGTQACLQPLSTLLGHTSAVTAVVFNSKGCILASTSIDKTTRLWQVPVGACIKILEGHSRYTTCCAFSRDDALLATGSNDKSLLVWDLAGNLHLGSDLAVSDNDNTCADTNKGGKRLLRRENGVKLWQRLEQCNNTINSIHFSGSHTLATAGSDRNVRLWIRGVDSRFTESPISPLKGHRYAVNQVDFSLCGGMLASCSLDGTTILWDSQSGAVVRSGFHVSGAGVRTVRFSPDSRLLVTGGDDETASVWRADTCSQITVLTGHTDAVTCAAFTADSHYLLTGCTGGRCNIYSLIPCSSVSLAVIENAHDLGVASADFSPYNHSNPRAKECYTMATCGNDGHVRVWQLRLAATAEPSGRVLLVWRLAGHGGHVTCVRYSPGLAELIASTATDKTCRLWDSYSGDCVHVLDQHDSLLTSCAFSPDATLLATGSLDKGVLLWELPKDFAFQSFVANRTRGVGSVNHWFREMNLMPAACGGIELHSTASRVDQLKIDEVDLRLDVELCLPVVHRSDSGLVIPHEFVCPITHQVMRDPVTCADGYTYERSAIESWLSSGRMTSPMTNASLESHEMTPNVTLTNAISRFLLIDSAIVK